MANSANLPAPFRGVDQKIPVAALKSPFCEKLLNFNVTEAGISLRHGDSKYKSISSVFGTSARRLFPYGNTSLFAAVLSSTNTMDFYDVDAGTISYSTAALGNAQFHSLYFNGYLFFFDRASYAPGVSYNGTAFAVIGYSGTGFLPMGGNSYKNRAYIIQFNDAAYWYSGINAISGALTKIDLNSVVSEKSTLITIAAITIGDDITNPTYQAFVFSSGEVIFYTGSWPDSDDWAEVGRARVGQPVNYNAGVRYQGDFLLFCDSGVVSLRDLFLRGSERAASLTVNTRIQKPWSDLVQAIRTSLNIPNGPMEAGNIRGVWDPTTNRIIISFSDYLNSSGTSSVGSFYFIYNTVLESWFFHRSFGFANTLAMADIVRYKNKTLTLAQGFSHFMVFEKEGATGYADRDVDDATDNGFDYEMLDAPIPFPKNAVYEATQIEPILESDLYAETNWSFVVDFGRQTSGNQKTDASTTAVAKPAVNVGIQNITYVQVKMAGTTVANKTVGLDLYSYNIWYDAGERASR